MAETLEKEKKSKKSSKDKSDKSERKPKKDKSAKKEKHQAADQTNGSKAFSLLASNKSVDSTLSALFAPRASPPRDVVAPSRPKSRKRAVAKKEAAQDSDEEDDDDEDGGALAAEPPINVKELDDATEEVARAEHPKRKRKRKDAHDELEDEYMARLGREEAKETEAAAAERAAKRQKSEPDQESDAAEDESDDDAEDETMADASSDAGTPPPLHETQDNTADTELAKANRTVFLGNVSSTAITSKTARKTLEAHLTSFFPKSDTKASSDIKSKPSSKTPIPRLESLRFRSTAYTSSGLPRKASFAAASTSLMPSTTQSTNAYAIYSTPALALQACNKLNATIILNRHLRVDSTAHPSPQVPRRCVFVGNLGFVDDETAIRAANKEAGYEDRAPAKNPADLEEGLWRTFGAKAGAVESVRVVRDEKTRVGKGFAYVQFKDENSVEAALLLNEKKFPPMLPRKLRVTRARATKRNAKGADSSRPGGFAREKARETGYKRKITPQEASQLGRAGKLLGRAAAAQQAKASRGSGAQTATGTNGTVVAAKGEGERAIKAPESFVFEGHRARVGQGKQGLKLSGKGGGGAGKKKAAGKPTGRSAKRGAAFKAGGGKKKRAA